MTMMLLTVAGLGAILKGFDWEEALVMGVVSLAALSQMALFDRPSEGDWFGGADLIVAAGAPLSFVVLGTLSLRLGAPTLAVWSRIGYRLEASRFLRTAASMDLAVLAASGARASRARVTVTT